ncbi:MAG TPA: 2-oxo acid dehydrogenase subunit E2 [Caulobacteraceae bacterium]
MTRFIDLLVPAEQEGSEAVVRAWLKQVGEAVAKDEPVVELETDKVAVEIAAPEAGVLAEQVLAVDADAAPGAVLGRIQVGIAAAPSTPSGSASPANGGGSTMDLPLRSGGSTALRVRPEDGPRINSGREGGARDETRLSPSVRRLVRESGVDPAAIAGSGRGGRLTRADVAAAIERRGLGGGSRKVPHDRMRRQIAEHMVRSVTVAPHVTAVFEADFSAVVAHREATKAALAAKGIGLTYTAYIVAAAARAMAAAPAVNSRWHEDHLELFDDVHVGVGTALGEAGLIVPVIRRAQALELEAIAGQLTDLTARARAGNLTPADVQGGTFSISNHGVSGSLVAAPIIINQPQSAILGVGKLEKRVVVREVGGADAIQIRPMAYVSLTIDHRVIDAVQTNAWLARFVEILEAWPADS